MAALCWKMTASPCICASVKQHQPEIDSSSPRMKTRWTMRAWLQVILSVVALLVLITISARIVRQEALVDSGLIPIRQQDALLLRPSTGSGMVIGTSSFTHPSKADTIYDLMPSKDRAGGDQLSLSFRLKLVSLQERTDRCILLWGDKNYVDFTPKETTGAKMSHLLVFMPMIWISTEYTSDKKVKHKLSVFFNCNKKAFNVCTGYIETDPPRLDLTKDGAVITVAFTDYSVNLVSKGCMCSLYVNARLAGSVKVEHDTIRRNIGLMYILPDTSVLKGINDRVAHDDPGKATSNVRISDLSYHNYELGVTEISDKVRGVLQYTSDRDLGGKNDTSGVYDATQDLTYHNLITPVYV
jgi:hypothetical protein